MKRLWNIFWTTEDLEAVLEPEVEDETTFVSDEFEEVAEPTEESLESEEGNEADVVIVERDLRADQDDPKALEAANLVATGIWEEEPDDQESIEGFFELLEGTVSLCADNGEHTVGVVVLRPDVPGPNEATISLLAVDEACRAKV